MQTIDPWEAKRQAREFKAFCKKVAHKMRKAGQRPRSKRYIDLRHSRIAEDRYLMDPEGQDIQKRKKRA